MQDIFGDETIVNFSIKNLNRAHINYQSSKKNEKQAGIQTKSIEAELEEMEKTDNA